MRIDIDGLAESQKRPFFVIPAKAGIQEDHPAAAGLDSRRSLSRT